MVVLSIIIVNYNVRHFLEQALLSVRRAVTNMEVEIFVVDNNSVDDSVQMVRQRFPEVKLIANTQNTGFSVANNQAMRLATGKYILLLNPDTVVEEDTFDKCVAFMDAHPDAGGLGVKMIDGSGNFLPESKRGFPAPFVAFCKTFGLARLFPKSKLFNRYHLGFLDPNETHEVDVLAGAFMLMRKSVLDKVGLLDEAFFMYGEDIDLSYRIVKGGFKNYYFPETSIIHYKGESTKRGSLNYVRTFYNAMIIFARKHFTGESAKLFVLMLQFAIYFRAGITLFSNFIKKIALPFLDALVLFAGIYFLKEFWEWYYFKTPDYYQSEFTYFNIPLYVLIWISSIFLSGGYDEKGNLRALARGILLGTVFLAAVYGFLPLHLRSSRMLIVLGMMWALFSTISLRTVIHFVKQGNFKVGKEQNRNIIIVGKTAESERVQNLLGKAQFNKNIIGTVAPNLSEKEGNYLSYLDRLDEVVQIYKIDEIIFCSEDVSTRDILHWMTRLGEKIDYKIVPQESLSIIGSSSKNSRGELYTIEIQFNLSRALHRRNKRAIDVLLSLLFLVLSPLLIFFIPYFFQFVKNCFQVLLARKSWVGYASQSAPTQLLPKIFSGILSPLDIIHVTNLDDATIGRVNFLYAKDYELEDDLEIIWKAFRKLGRKK